MQNEFLYAVNREQETLTASTVYDAVKEYTDAIDPDEIPDEVEVHQFRQLKINDGVFSQALENLYEQLDEEYGNPGGPYENTPSPLANALYLAFADQVVKEYVVYSWEPTGNKITVSTKCHAEKEG